VSRHFVGAREVDILSIEMNSRIPLLSSYLK